MQDHAVGVWMSFTAVGQLEQHVALLLQPVPWRAVTVTCGDCDVGQLQWPLVAGGYAFRSARASHRRAAAAKPEGRCPMVSHGVPWSSSEMRVVFVLQRIFDRSL